MHWQSVSLCTLLNVIKLWYAINPKKTLYLCASEPVFSTFLGKFSPQLSHQVFWSRLQRLCNLQNPPQAYLRFPRLDPAYMGLIEYVLRLQIRLCQT